MNYRWLLLTLIWLLSLLLINTEGAFPLNDDWQYAYAVQSLLEDGTLDYRGFFSPIVLVQVLWGYLFHSLFSSTFSFTILRWSTLVLVPMGIWAMHFFSQRLRVSKQANLFVGFAFISTPLLYSLAPSFMSDVPFLIVSLVALVAYWRFWESSSLQWLAGALFLAILAFYIRQPGLLLPLIFAGHWVWSKALIPSSAKGFKALMTAHLRSLVQWRNISILASATLFAALLLLSWKWGLQPALGLSDNFKGDEGNYLSILIHTPLTFGITWSLRMVKSFVYLGFFTLLFLPWWLQDVRVRSLLFTPRFLIGSTVISLFLVVSAYLAGKPFPFGGNIFYNLGLGPELLADTYTLLLPHTPGLPAWTMGFFHLAAAWWGLAVLYVFIHRFRQFSRPQRAYIQLWVILSLLYLSIMAITSYYDRYVLLPLALLLPMLALPCSVFRDPFKKRWAAYIPLLLVAFFSITATHDYLAWNRARLGAWQWLEKQEVSIQQVDAGYEWNGWLNYGSARIDAENVPFWWVTDNEYILTFGPIVGYRPVHQESFYRWLWSREDAIFVLQRE